ncbi:hypothetical protein TH66_18495 [Carbonactinospora thermoautotrophica]|uniref:Uncharacterized protein n=2 Tax=Carbonactinospora thermoautotrophica TaxID=1469144 RepID=A0A132MIF4_9ACTN|nr:hypothetical protein TH66_18495 [Carbonactinospora thermoautotrophica]KWX08285.1 hypothetical protein TR74_15670 [Carbonactinospora thermoautotrophica]
MDWRAEEPAHSPGEAPDEPAGTASPPPDAEDDLDEQLDEEQQRVEEEIIRLLRRVGVSTWLNPVFAGPVSFGGHAAGRDVTFGAVAGMAVRVTGPVPVDAVDTLRAVYVPFEAYDRALWTLRRHHVLILCGPASSGKHTSALCLLGAVAGERLWSLDAEAWLDQIDERDLREGCGYLIDTLPLERTRALTPTRINWLARLLEERDAYLVVTVAEQPERLPVDRLDQYLVEHRPPDPRDLLYSHLGWRLGGRERVDETLLADMEVVRALEAAPLPGQVAELAAVLAQVARGDLTLDAALDRLRERARGRAKQLLAARPDDDPAESLRLRAFLIALSVFNDLPYTQVVDAAEALETELRQVEVPGAQPGRPIFAHPRQYWLQVAHAKVETRPAASWRRRPVECVAFRNPALPMAVLDVVWQDYDAARSPILRWLRQLAGSRGVEIRVRAAQAVGKFAVHDFDHVYQEVIHPWASSPRRQERESAAWALEIVACDSELAPQVRRLLRNWCRSGSLARQRTAVLAYGTDIGALFPDDALRNLTYFSRNERPDVIRAVGNSLAEMFEAGRQADVLHTLRGWTASTDRRQRRLGIRCFVRLVQNTRLDSVGTRPALLADDERWLDGVTGLWRAALVEPGVRAEAWEALCQWFSWADTDPGLLTPLIALAGELAADEAVRERLRFYLRVWSSHRQQTLASAEKVLSSVMKD